MNNKSIYKVVGTKHFDSQIDITDPGYKRYTLGRLNDVKIKEGEYQCIIWNERKSYNSPSGELRNSTYVSKIGIYLGEIPDMHDFEEIGEIGVDSGMAGFFNHKPDYTIEEWLRLCESIHSNSESKEYYINDEGFFSNSGRGDGCYSVYAAKDGNGEITSLEIAFM